jgi:hypothetical protein
MATYLAMIGDVVVGAGDSMTGATLDAMQRADNMGMDLEQAGKLEVVPIFPSQRYTVGSTIDWTDHD